MYFHKRFHVLEVRLAQWLGARKRKYAPERVDDSLQRFVLMLLEIFRERMQGLPVLVFLE
jgi:hypothetical protein